MSRFDATAFLATLPHLPGVYRMLDEQGNVLYVGKAADLRKRVASYFQKNDHSPRIRMMISRIAGIEITVTASEAEALLLENNLIKALAPRYNILFRDDKSYPYLLLTGHAFPRMAYFRGTPKRADSAFGPFPGATAVRDSMDILQKVFRLRTCEDSVFEHRSRPCLLFQIKRCRAPCTGEISREDYARDVQAARDFLHGKTDQVLQTVTDRMQQAADAMRYELAAVYRDQIRSLSAVREQQTVDTLSEADVDVLAAVSAQGMVCVNLTMIRGGRHLGDRSQFPRHGLDAGPAEALQAFIAQHYAAVAPPTALIVSEPLEDAVLIDWLAQRAGRKVALLHRVSGQRRRWLDMAIHNARLAIVRQVGLQATQTQRLLALQQTLELPDLQRIECFDISHTMGEATIASCVVYDQTAMQPGQYRRFNIRSAKAGDDYAAMHEALRRRYERIRDDALQAADLILIDGGLGQLRAAAAVLAELGINDVLLIGVAKGVERKAGMEQLVTLDGQARRLSADDPALHLIQQIRDEAHRFAITGHRAKRAKARTESVLQDIPGVGPKRRQKLLERFGGLRELKNASAEDIAKVDGISRELAEQVYRALR